MFFKKDCNSDMILGIILWEATSRNIYDIDLADIFSIEEEFNKFRVPRVTISIRDIISFIVDYEFAMIVETEDATFLRAVVRNNFYTRLLNKFASPCRATDRTLLSFCCEKVFRKVA